MRTTSLLFILCLAACGGNAPAFVVDEPSDADTDVCTSCIFTNLADAATDSNPPTVGTDATNDATDSSTDSSVTSQDASHDAGAPVDSGEHDSASSVEAGKDASRECRESHGHGYDCGW